MEPRIIGNNVVLPACPVTMTLPGVKTATIQGRQYVALPYTDDAVRLLTNIGKPIPGKIETAYNWPGRFKPYKHQVATASFLSLNRRSYVLSGMGVGKTISALWAADYLMSKGDIRRVMIISPLSTLERVWGDEIFRNFPHRRFAVLHGSRQKRLDLLKENHDFYIINHDGISIIKDDLRSDIDLLVVDEIASFRNQKTTKWKTAKEIALKVPYMWGLTGTPTPNAPTDAYAQMKLITPEKYPHSYTRFKMETMRQITAFKWIPRAGSEKLVNEVLSPAIRFNLRDCIDLPETIYHEREAALTDAQKKHIQMIERECVTDIGDKQVTAVNAAVMIQKIVQMGCGVSYASDGESVEVDFGPRYSVLEEAIEEASSKVIVFVPFTAMLDALAERLRKRWSVAVIDGGVSAGKRNQIFSDFQEKKDPHILLANPGTMSHGLTLTAADTIIWYAPIWSGEIYPQANARIARPGQKLVTNIVHIYATSTERKIYQVLKEKGKMQDIVLSLVNSA